MKDFHDLYALTCVVKGSSFDSLHQAIQAVFDRLGTALQLPISYTQAGLLQLQEFWTSYLKALKPEHREGLPTEIAQVVDRLNQWLHNEVLVVFKR